MLEERGRSRKREVSRTRNAPVCPKRGGNGNRMAVEERLSPGWVIWDFLWGGFH